MQLLRRGRWGLVALYGIVAVLLPVLLADLPPSADLPQHVAQARLFEEWLGGSTRYTVQWNTPYLLPFAVTVALWNLLAPLAVGKALLATIGVLWVVACVAAARALQRSAASALIASVFFFNASLYWGFVPFLFGAAVFVAFVTWVERTELRQSHWVLCVLTWCALYSTHALWWIAAVLWLLARIVTARAWRAGMVWLLGLLPSVVVAVFWYPSLARRGFAGATEWATPVYARLDPAWIAENAWGGLRGSMEPIALLFVLGWILVALWQHRADLRSATQRGLLLAAALLFACAFLLPTKAQNTLLLAERWLPYAIALLVLGVPAPRLAGTARALLALAFAGAFTLATTFTWLRFEADEQQGLVAALHALPRTSRVLGLVFSAASPLLRGYPHMQTPAYGQVLHGGTLGFSFAELAPMPVVVRKHHQPSWTPNLEWHPELVRTRDVLQFDYLLVRAPAPIHAAFASKPHLHLRSGSAAWRLYQVIRPR